MLLHCVTLLLDATSCDNDNYNNKWPLEGILNRPNDGDHKSKEEDKDKESIQSSTKPDPRHHLGK